MDTLAQKIAAASIAVGTFAADKRNNEQGYDYISADAVLARGGNALAAQGVTVFPSVVSFEIVPVERPNKGPRYDARVSMIFVVSAGGDEKIELMWAGMGSDYAVPDKAYYKALTSGHKYFLMKLLNIGAGNEDGEHEPDEPRGQGKGKPAARPAGAEIAS